MAFDPDAYLASKKPAFDPDAYLASKSAAAPESGVSGMDYAKGVLESAGRTAGKAAIKAGMLIPDVATDVVNLIPESVLGPKTQRPSEFWEQKLFGESRPGEELTSTAMTLAPAGIGAARAVPAIGKAIIRDYKTGELLPKVKGVASDVARSVEKFATKAESRAAAERAAAEQKALAEHSDAQKAAMATAEQAKRDAATRAKEAGATSAAEIRKQRGLQTAAERDAEDSMSHAGITPHKNDLGERLRSDIADAHLEARMRIEQGGAYTQFDEALEKLDETDPFQFSRAGQQFFKMLDERISPSFSGGKVLRQQSADEAVAERIRNQLVGKPVSEEVTVPVKKDPITNTVTEWGKATKTGVRPRFGQAIENALKDIRHEQAEAGRAGIRTLQKRWEELGDKLEASLNEWAGTKYPKEQYAKISERANQLSTDAVRKTLDKTGAEQLRPEQKLWSTNSSDLPDLWFSGPDRAAELRSIVGEQKFATYAEERASSQIAGKSASETLKWAKADENKWIDTVPGLRNKVEAYAERMAKFSGDRKQVEAVIAGERQRLATLGKETKAAIKDARAARDAAIQKAGTARDKALQAAAQTEESRMKAVQKTVDFMTGKRPSVAMQHWDDLAESARAAGMTEQEIASIRGQLQQALEIENKSEQWRKMRQILYPVFGLTAAGAKKLESLMGGP